MIHANIMNDEFEALLVNTEQVLLAEQHPDGYWIGELSASALSTATAVFTLSLQARTPTTSAPAAPRRADLVLTGLRWLADHQNADGGWGDTTQSLSNISTTALGWAVFAIPEAAGYAVVAERAADWLRRRAGGLEPSTLAQAIAERYGKDRTFSVPILTMLALAGRLGVEGWKLIPQLPFELAALPFWCFQVVQLPVVSYALPALIAMGLVRHHRRPSGNPVSRGLRALVVSRTLKKLRTIQPTTGGYLEATPLTSFVCMSLIAAGRGDHDVVRHGVDFLERSVRLDGSWPIDTNLATWVTTLAVNAGVRVAEPARLRQWLLGQQYRGVHPYTRAAPGGWAWTNLSGGVPDADDTPSALLALRQLGDPDEATRQAAAAGVNWLLDLQNRDGGIPTFCRGWTGLPFDRSSNDLTAHALRAWSSWRPEFPVASQTKIERATGRAVAYLKKTQRADGTWAPLWFGNQHAEEIENLTYGTSRVLRLAEVPEARELLASELDRAVVALLEAQNHDGGWGGRRGTPSSIEETALALEGLACYQAENPGSPSGPRLSALQSGLQYLQAATQRGTRFTPSPIGFYFANLWYFEKLYPSVFTRAALKQLARLVAVSCTSR